MAKCRVLRVTVEADNGLESIDLDPGTRLVQDEASYLTLPPFLRTVR